MHIVADGFLHKLFGNAELFSQLPYLSTSVCYGGIQRSRGIPKHTNLPRFRQFYTVLCKHQSYPMFYPSFRHKINTSPAVLFT